MDGCSRGRWAVVVAVVAGISAVAAVVATTGPDSVGAVARPEIGQIAEGSPSGQAAAAAPAQAAIIVDHRSTDVSAIPDEWITRAKALTLHYAHTSHGSQLIAGAQDLEGVDGRFDVAVRTSGEVGLPTAPGALRIYDGQPGDTYVTPELYWATADGLRRTRTVADTGDYDYSMWSWCGQQSSNSVATVEQYLAALDDLEREYPDMRFIYMTGHTDGGSATLTRNNQMVRDYAAAHGKVLFDFADIESYDPAGTYYPKTTDACAWCETWCAEHPGDCRNMAGSCAHSHPFNCRRKGYAFWWMMARLAGWAGPGGVATPTSPPPTAVEPPPTAVEPPPTSVDPPPTRVPTGVPTAGSPEPSATPIATREPSPEWRIILPWTGAPAG